MKRGVELYERVVELRRESKGKSNDAALAEIIKDANQRAIFRGMMSTIATEQSSEMSAQQRRERASAAAKEKWRQVRLKQKDT